MKSFKEFRKMLGTDAIDQEMAKRGAETAAKHSTGDAQEFYNKKAKALAPGKEASKKPMAPHKDFASPTSAKPGRSSSARGDE